MIARADPIAWVVTAVVHLVLIGFATAWMVVPQSSMTRSSRVRIDLGPVVADTEPAVTEVPRSDGTGASDGATAVGSSEEAETGSGRGEDPVSAPMSDPPTSIGDSGSETAFSDGGEGAIVSPASGDATPSPIAADAAPSDRSASLPLTGLPTIPDLPVPTAAVDGRQSGLARLLEPTDASASARRGATVGTTTIRGLTPSALGSTGIVGDGRRSAVAAASAAAMAVPEPQPLAGSMAAIATAGAVRDPAGLERLSDALRSAMARVDAAGPPTVEAAARAGRVGPSVGEGNGGADTAATANSEVEAPWGVRRRTPVVLGGRGAAGLVVPNAEVEVAVVIGPTGEVVGEQVVRRSSGSSEVDAAVIRAIRGYLFTPSDDEERRGIVRIRLSSVPEPTVD